MASVFCAASHSGSGSVELGSRSACSPTLSTRRWPSRYWLTLQYDLDPVLQLGALLPVQCLLMGRRLGRPRWVKTGRRAKGRCTREWDRPGSAECDTRSCSEEAGWAGRHGDDATHRRLVSFLSNFHIWILQLLLVPCCSYGIYSIEEKILQRINPGNPLK